MLLHFFTLNCSHASVLTSQQNHFWLAIELHINESQYLCRYVFLWMSIFATNQRQPILKRCWLLIAVAVRINWSVYLLQISMKVSFCNQSSGSMMNWTEKRRKLIIMSSNKWLTILPFVSLESFPSCLILGTLNVSLLDIRAYIIYGVDSSALLWLNW